MRNSKGFKAISIATLVSISQGAAADPSQKSTIVPSKDEQIQTQKDRFTINGLPDLIDQYIKSIGRDDSVISFENGQPCLATPQ